MCVGNQLRWSDIWFLVALYFCGLRGHDKLKDAIAAADAMNHAVINFEEISSALVRLERHGLISVQKNPWRAWCTKKSNALIQPISEKNSLSFHVWKETEKALKVSPWLPRESLPNQENYLRYPDFTYSEYEKEVASYLEAIRIKE